ncbi:hypothetical protein ID866_4566, partial [Astraeus odoratus]
MAMHVLRQVMQMVMVRHRVEDVEQDVCLPPMKHEVVYMDLSEYALQSYNALQAGIVINAVDSERRDQVPKEDFELLQSALAHAAAAASDKLWRAMQRHEDVPF